MCYWVKSSNERLKTTTHYDSEPEQKPKIYFIYLIIFVWTIGTKISHSYLAKQYNQSKQPENQPKKHL